MKLEIAGVMINVLINDEYGPQVRKRKKNTGVTSPIISIYRQYLSR